jgi:hypothetical protein
MKFILKSYLKKQHFLQQVKPTAHTLGMRTSIFSLQKVIYILKPLIIGPRHFYKHTVSERGNSVYK